VSLVEGLGRSKETLRTYVVTPQLAPAVAKLETWARGRQFLLVPYHVIGSKILESAILGGYVHHVKALHPEATMPGGYLSDGVVHNAVEIRAGMGDAAPLSPSSASCSTTRASWTRRYRSLPSRPRSARSRRAGWTKRSRSSHGSS